MKKAALLREALCAAVPELRADPSRLKLWVENGTGQSRQTESLAFGFAYRVNVLVEEAETDVALFALAIFRWLRVQQPALLAPGVPGFTFDADILDNGSADVLFQLDLTENVSVAARSEADGGGFMLTYLAEPDPLFGDALGLGGTDPIPPLAEVVTIADSQA